MHFFPKNSEYFNCIIALHSDIRFFLLAVSQANPEQEDKGSAGPKLLSSFEEAELAKQNLELCPEPGPSGESYKTVRNAVWRWVCAS